MPANDLSSVVECWQSFEICYILSHMIEDMGINSSAVYRQVINSFKVLIIQGRTNYN